MKKQKSIKVNFVMNIILTLSSFVFQLITFPYISRILLPEGTGKVSFAISLINYFAIFANLGIPTYGIRACAKIRDNKEELTKTAQELLIINLVMCAFSYIVLFATLIFVPKFREDRVLYMIVSLNIILTCIGMEWIYKALEQYTYITVRSIIFKFIALSAMFLFVHKKSDYMVYGGITVLASSASYILNFINVHQYISLKPIRHYDFKRHLKTVGIFFAMSCATTVYLNLDAVMLGFMTTEVDVGYYDAAVKIRKILLSIVSALGTVLLPRVSYYIENTMLEKFRSTVKKAFSFVLLAALPVTVYFILFAQEGIFFLSGSAYAGAIVPMQIIMPTVLLVGITNIMGIQMLVPLGRERVVLLSEIAGAVFDVSVNLLLIPRYAAIGVAIGTLGAEAVVLIVQYIALRGEVKEAIQSIHYGRMTAALIFACAASMWVKWLHIGCFPALLISGVLFFAVYGIFLMFQKEELVIEIVDSIKKFLEDNK